MSFEISHRQTVEVHVRRRPWNRTRALPRGQLISCACCVSATALQQPRQASPERVGEYSQTWLFYRAVWKSVNAKHCACGRWAAFANESGTKPRRRKPEPDQLKQKTLSIHAELARQTRTEKAD